MTVLKETKTHYSESEAASELGITVEQLQGLIRDHIVKNDAELNSAPVETFAASDLLLLRLICQSPGMRLGA